MSNSRMSNSLCPAMAGAYAPTLSGASWSSGDRGLTFALRRSATGKKCSGERDLTESQKRSVGPTSRVLMGRAHSRTAAFS
jgi:hypothetical protein